MGLLLWIFFLYVLLLVSLFILICLEKTIFCCCSCFQRLRLKVQQKLLWNTFIRLFMEMFADMAITAFLNVYTADWDSASSVVRYSNMLAVIFLTILGLTPLLLICIYQSKWSQVHDEGFQATYGTFLEGTMLENKRDLKWVLLLLPIIFLVRRIAFIISVLFMSGYLWAQLLL